MDTLDNANNPFAIPNKTNNVDSITSQADDGLLLNFAEELKKNEELPNNDLIKMLEKSNRGRLTPDFDKEDNLGPETNVDNPDDGPTFNNNQNGNPFGDIEKTLELNLNLKEGTFEGLTSPDVEECVPPVNSVHNVPQLIDAGADSDSEEEEEWNYVRGEEANKENAAPSQLSSQVAEEEEEDLENAMSQLNPNAAEFIPSPARAVASPLGRLLDEDKVLSRSPKKPPPTEVDINVPDQSDFEEDISQKPHEIEKAFSNGHQDGFDSETNAINALNSRLDEFHFGRNAVPFTPVKLLDQSEASSTRANYGDESAMTLGASFDDSALLGQDQGDFVHKDDPMSMSFHQDRSDDSNIFDLNKVHVLPEDVDEFIAKGGANNSLFDDTISDLTEHYPLGKHAEENPKDNEIELAIELGHDDQKIEHLEANKSSTPIEDRSKSPSDIQSPLEEDRGFSPRDELKTPSSVGECEIQNAEHHSIPQGEEEECRLKSPNEQNKPKSPFEDEHLISPVEEKVSPSPFEEKELYSTHEEKEVCSPVEEKDVCCLMGKQNEPQNEKEVYEEKDLLSEKEIIQEEKLLIEEKQSNIDDESMEKEVTEEKDVHEEEHIPSEHQNQSPIQDSQITSPQQETKDFLGEANAPSDFEPKTEEIVEKIQEETTTVLDKEIISPLQDLRVTSPAPSETTTASPVQEKEISSIVQDLDMASPSQEESSLVEKVESPLLEQEVSTAEINDFVAVNTSESLGELQFEPFKATNACDKVESPLQEQSNEELLNFETEKSDQEKAKEILDNSPEDVNKEESLKPESLCDTKEESANFSVTNQSEISSPQEVGESDLDFHSQSAPEADQVLIDVSNGSYSLNKSAADTSSTNTYDINSFLDRSTLEGVEYPITPNLSTDAISNQQNAVQNTEISQSSPIKDQQPDLFKVASSTPVAEKSEVIQPSVTEVKSPVADKTASSKETDKKPATKSKVAPSTTTAKKTPTPRNSLAPTKPTAKPSPKPAAKTIPKSSSATSKVNSTTKTETAAPKLASKSSATAAPRTGTATRAPLTSRPKLPATNGTAKPAPKSTTGTVRKTIEGSTMKSTTSTSLSKTTSSTTARSTVASARSATTTAAPKPRPNTLKPATTRTVDSSKPTTASARTATTAARVPASSRTAATKTSSSLANKETASKTSAKPRSVTDKQVKDTTNKLTAASRTVSKTTSTVQSLAKSTTVTKKTEVTGTKTTTTRTTTASRPPIKRPTDATKTATTKVGKPKQNGVAPVVTEKIIVNNASKELKTNGDQEFVKDNSPVDNKLIADKLTESAAN